MIFIPSTNLEIGSPGGSMVFEAVGEGEADGEAVGVVVLVGVEEGFFVGNGVLVCVGGRAAWLVAVRFSGEEEHPDISNKYINI
jgi:hypothetical protein